MNRSSRIWKLCMGAVGSTAICLVVTSLYRSSDQSLQIDSKNRIKRQESSGGVASKIMSTDAEFWQGINMTAQSIPSSVLEAAKSISVSQGTLQMPQGAKVFYQYSLPLARSTDRGQFVLLLHGAAFTSQNWVDLGTIPLLAGMGHTAVAIDIPGYGKSSGDFGSREDFVSTIVSLLEKEGRVSAEALPVVVSPSMSGSFSIPALQAESSKAAAREPPSMAAYVPVAPVSTKLLTEAQALNVKIPTLILYGERDKGLGTSSVRDLRHIPTSQVVEIKDAGHAAYMNQPDLFHKLLYNFLGYVDDKSSGGVASKAMPTDAEFWQGINMTAQSIPSSVLEAAKSISVSQGTLQTPQGGKVFYQFSLPPAPPTDGGQFVLLLHGAAFTSQNWVDIGTIPLLAAMGHSAVAIDIPGFGKSTGDFGSQEHFVSTIVSLLEKEGRVSAVALPVVVSPSMSGSFSIPALQAEVSKAAAGEPPSMAGYVPVAPVSTNLLTEAQALNVKIPTLILYGERDKGLGTTSVRDLRHIPTSQVVEIKDAGHAAYMNQPDLFHKLLYNFLSYVDDQSG